MRIFMLAICVLLALKSCTNTKSYKKNEEMYPVIDIVNSVGNYQKVYFSDYFSSIELIALETNNNSLIGEESIVLVYDSLIFIASSISSGVWPPHKNLLVFNRSGKFLNSIGAIGKGPGEYLGVSEVFLNHEKPTVYVADSFKIFEFEFNGKFIGSFTRPNPDGRSLWNVTFLEDNLFLGAISYDKRNEYKYYLFDKNGDVIKYFHTNLHSDTSLQNAWSLSVAPYRIDNHVYVMDYINDTLYTIENLRLSPVYVFDYGKFAYPIGKNNEKGQRNIIHVDNTEANKQYMRMMEVVGTPTSLFYSIRIPSLLSIPKTRSIYNSVIRREMTDATVLGIFNITEKTNTLLDTDAHQFKGLINDLNGGLSFFPKYYAGNDLVLDIWQVEDMKKILTEEHFSTLQIKDQLAHQKLKELLINLKDDDNPVVVIAKLK